MYFGSSDNYTAIRFAMPLNEECNFNLNLMIDLVLLICKQWFFTFKWLLCMFFFLFVIWNKRALNALKFLHFEYDFIRCNNIEFSEQMFSELITSLNSIHGYFLPQIGMRLRFKYIAWTLASNTSVQSLYLPKYQIKCE